MLGKIVKVKITSPYGSQNKKYGFIYKLNFGIIENVKHNNGFVPLAYVMGIEHPVKKFEGRIIAAIKRPQGKGVTWVVAPKSSRFINHDIMQAISFAEQKRSFVLECLYENSCGAVVFKNFGKLKKFLLIRNKRSLNWGFPKGHVEKNETKIETAKREVLEETGVSINIIEGFEERSQYTIHGKIDKLLILFLAFTNSSNYKMQEAEIAEIGWFEFDNAMDKLNFPNDKRILKSAFNYISVNNL